MRFTSKLSALALAAAGMAAAVGAQAQSIDVRVIGTITPPACTPTLTGGGVVDYGKIPASTLNQTSPTLLESKSVAFSITCDAATRVAVKLVDNRASSRVSGIIGSAMGGRNDSEAFGLGVAGGKNIGVYGIQLQASGVTLDGVTGANSRSADSGTSWIGPFNGFTNHTAGYLYSWRKTGDTLPSAFTTMASTLNVRAVIDSAANLDLTNEVELDGLATMELVYL